MDRVEAYFESGSPDTDTITAALWSASKGRQRKAAQYLLGHGGDLNWIGWDDQTCLDIALAGDDTEFIAWLCERGAKTAAEIQQT